jgi:hypothetical protein
MEVLELDPKILVMAKPDDKERTFSKAFAEKLAVSIDNDGLLELPVVRELPDKKGFYEVVAGMHRVFACAKVLKWPAIPCSVIVGMSDAQAAAARRAENIFRNPLTKEQHLLAVTEWYAAYNADNPGSVDGRGKYDRAAKAEAKAAAEPKADAAPANGAAPAPEAAKSDTKPAAEAPKEAKKPVTPFSEVLAGASGMSERHARRMAKIASSFTAEQVAVLGPLVSAHKVTLGDLGDMAKALNTPEARAKVVALLASGMKPVEALAQAKKLAKKTDKPKTDADLTDDEWLNAHCSKQLANLKKKDEFKANAILYRRLADMRNRFRSASKKIRDASKGAGVKGPFYNVVQRVTQCQHPSHWLVCGACGGTGINNQTQAACPHCYGAAFKLSSDPES